MVQHFIAKADRLVNPFPVKFTHTGIRHTIYDINIPNVGFHVTLYSAIQFIGIRTEVSPYRQFGYSLSHLTICAITHTL